MRYICIIVSIMLFVNVHLAMSTPFPCTFYSSSITSSNGNIALNIDYAYGNTFIQASDLSQRQFDSLSGLCACTNLNPSFGQVRLKDITTLIVKNQQINATHLPPTTFDCLTGLQSVDLSRNSFPFGLSPGLFRYQSRVSRLQLDSCQIVVLPSNLASDLTNLTSLSITNNRFVSLPSDVFSNSIIRTIYMDDNLLLEWIPPATLVSNRLTFVSIFRSPSLSCLPAVMQSTVIASDGLQTCSPIVSMDVQTTGQTITCQHVKIQFPAVWDVDDPTPYLNNFVIDLSTSLYIDSSRIINPIAVDDQGHTYVSFDILPRSRHSQITAESVPIAITSQLSGDPTLNRLQYGLVSNKLTAQSKVDSTVSFRKYCPDHDYYSAVPLQCLTDSKASPDSFLGISQEILVVIIIVVGIVLGLIVVNVMDVMRNGGPAPGLSNERTSAIKSSPTLMNHLSSSARLQPVPSIHQRSQYESVHSRATLPEIASPQRSLVMTSSDQLYAQPLTTHLSFRNDQPQQQPQPQPQQQQQQQPQQPKAGRQERHRKTKKWDAERLANPWIAKEADKSDNEEFW